VLGAEHRIQIALVLDNHTGTKQCRFDAAHKFTGRGPACSSFCRLDAFSEIPDGSPMERRME